MVVPAPCIVVFSISCVVRKTRFAQMTIEVQKFLDTWEIGTDIFRNAFSIHIQQAVYILKSHGKTGKEPNGR